VASQTKSQSTWPFSAVHGTRMHSGGSIDKRLWGKPTSSLTDLERLTWACDIAEGMAFIHSKGFTHRDLKSQNVLYDLETMRAKVADFGMSRSISAAHGTAGRLRCRGGTPSQERGLAGVIVFYYSIDEFPARSSALVSSRGSQSSQESYSLNVLSPSQTPRRKAWVAGSPSTCASKGCSIGPPHPKARLAGLYRARITPALS